MPGCSASTLDVYLPLTICLISVSWAAMSPGREMTWITIMRLPDAAISVVLRVMPPPWLAVLST
ncbi:hypothetical protein D3C80_2120050 [compost metagenome]